MLNKDCISFNNDAKLYIEEESSFAYPDGMVICGEVEISKHTSHASLPAFKEYIMIDQYKPVIDILYREDNSYWKMITLSAWINRFISIRLICIFPWKQFIIMQ